MLLTFLTTFFFLATFFFLTTFFLATLTTLYFPLVLVKTPWAVPSLRALLTNLHCFWSTFKAFLMDGREEPMRSLRDAMAPVWRGKGGWKGKKCGTESLVNKNSWRGFFISRSLLLTSYLLFPGHD